jgi:uncharacterized repeat protein (TIGR01451 family)
MNSCKPASGQKFGHSAFSRCCVALVMAALMAVGHVSANPHADASDDSDIVLAGPSPGTRGAAGVRGLDPWVVVSPTPFAVSRPGGVFLDGLFYVIGGEEIGGDRNGRVQFYDPEADLWDAVSADPMPTPVSNLCVAVLDGQIYVPGGWTGTVESTELQIFDPTTGTWTTATDDPLPGGRLAPACASHNGKLFVFGGDDGTNYTDTAWVYDPQLSAGNRWSTLSSSPFLHGYGSAVAGSNGLIFVTGFRNTNTDLNTVAAYDPDSDDWIAYPGLQTARGGAGVWTHGDLLYVGGGGWSSYLNSVELYDLSQGTAGNWEYTSPLNVGRRTAAAGTDPVTGELFIAAGWAGGFLDSVETLGARLTLGEVTAVDICAALPANNNGIFEPGEVVDLSIPLRAIHGDFSNVVGMLSSNSTGVSVINGMGSYGDIVDGTSVSANFSIRLAQSVSCGSPIDLTLAVSSNEDNLNFSIEREVGAPAMAYSDLPLAIPDNNPAGVPATVEVVGVPSPLTNVQVQINVQHTWVGDLIFTLTSPQGTVVTLLDRPGVPATGSGCNNNNVNVLFADGQPDPEEICTGNTFDDWPVSDAAPVTPLADLNGEDGNGTWTLTVSDNALADTGALVDWELILSPQGEAICNVCPSIADVAVNKTAAAPEPLLIGDSITYTLTASNTGPSQAQDVLVSDTLPSNVSYVSNDCGANFAAPSLTWDIGALDVGDDALCALTVTASDFGEISNTASIATSSDDPDFDNNTDTAVLAGVALPADLAISKDSDVSNAVPGESVTYTIVASNAGPGDALGSTVTDSFPAACTSVSWTCQGAAGGNCAANGSGDINEIVDLPNGGSVTFSAVCTIDSAATGTLSNTAMVSPPPGVSDPDLANNSATDEATLVPSADLALSKTTSGVPDPVQIGSSFQYLLSASNAGPSTATVVVVTDTLPSNVDYVSNDCGATFAAPTLSWNIGTMAPSGSADCIVTVVVNETGEIVNSASVSAATADPVPGNNTSSVVIGGVASADLSISKDIDVSNAVPGESVTYTVVASNAGPGDALGSTVTDSFPAACTTVNWTCQGDAGGNCAANGSGDINEIVDLPNGGSVTFSAVCTIDSAATGTLSNTAMVSPPPGVSDPDLANNTAMDEATLVPSADLALSKTASGVPDPVQIGSSFQYLLSASNAGPSTATVVVVTDTLPSNLDYVSNDCGATYAAPTLSWNIGTMAPSGSADCSVTVVVNDFGEIINNAGISAATDDPTAGDNTASAILAGVAFPADLSIALSVPASLEEPQVGDSYNYTVTVSNAGPGDADGLLMTMQLSPSLSYNGSTCSATFDGSEASWTLATLDAGDSNSCEISVTVLNPGILLASVEVSSSSDDPDLSNNSASLQLASMAVPVPALGIWALLLLALAMLVVMRRQLAIRISDVR